LEQTVARPFSENDFASVGKALSPGWRYLLAIVVIIFLLLALAGALAIPFLFESPTMWYKFGIEKVSLRTGKMLGMAAGLLLFLQLPLAGRLKFLDRIFSLPGLTRQHRIHAWAIAILALVHPLCVLLPEGTLIVPLEMRYWPEWVGVGLMAIILIQFICSRWRQPLGLAFHRWMPFHRIAGMLTVILMVVHVLYVSESFTDHGPPRLAVLVAAGVFCALWLWVRSGWLRVSHRPYVVSRVLPAGADSTCVEIMPSAEPSFAYLPGQFVIVAFQCDRISSEPHAFTLSSTPSRPGMLQLTIRACGDWTRDVGRLQPGDRALVQGPFGRFGHLFAGPNRPLIMIAGGIGITPMLSMLRFMADRSDPRPITLIWSNRSNAHVVFADEMDVLAAKLTGLRRIPIFTRNTGNGKRSGRLDRRSLELLLDGCSRGSAVFICGPPRMMTQVKTDLNTLGFPARSIFTEVFGF
jgi:predicted ferric reductase